VKRLVRLSALVAVMAAIPSARPAHAIPEVIHYGPFHSTSPDSGTCGNFWAEDTFDRVFRAHTSPNPDGTFTVVEEFKRGSFVTNAGQSPGGCDTNPGGTLEAGIRGKMHGTFVMVISGGSFDPNRVCSPETCNTTAGFVATVYGPGASFDIPTFSFHYVTPRNGQWQNASEDRGGNRGDISGAP
jgi:hypothetical protein